MPSLDNSPWTRGAPHNGFAPAIWFTSERMAASVLGRPGRIRCERCAQRRRSQWRCQRRTVSGCTNSRAVRHFCHTLASRIQKSRSVGRSGGLDRVRVNAANCWRSARFSRATARWPRHISPMDRRSRISAVSTRDPVANWVNGSSKQGRRSHYGERQRLDHARRCFRTGSLSEFDTNVSRGIAASRLSSVPVGARGTGMMPALARASRSRVSR